MKISLRGPIIFAMTLLSFFGLLTILSSQSESASPYYLAFRQLIALAIAAGLMFLCGALPFRSKADPKLVMPGKVELGLARGREKTARRILELLAGGPMRPSALREAVGIKSRIHFSRYYMTPLMEKGLVERTDPENPMSPRQEYKLA